jgi:hypothetical protein
MNRSTMPGERPAFKMKSFFDKDGSIYGWYLMQASGSTTARLIIAKAGGHRLRL